MIRSRPQWGLHATAVATRSTHGTTPSAPLVSSVVELANTLNAWRPFSRDGLSAGLAFAGGWPTSELPLHALGLSALRLAAAARRGDLRGGSGVAAIGLTGLSWLGLTAIYRRELESKAVLEQAIRQALGEAPEQRWAPSGVRSTSRQRLVPRRSRYVSTDSTHSYGGAKRSNKLDIWRHRDLPDDARAPVVLQVPGGGWVAGGRRGQAYPLLTRLAAAGWVGVSMSYRTSPRHPWQAHILDVKRALAPG